MASLGRLTNLSRFAVRPGVSAARGMATLPNTGALINGEWVKAASTFPTVNPGTEQHIADVTNCGAKEVDMAVAAAKEAMWSGAEGSWGTFGGYQRGILLNKLADAIEANQQELAELEVLDNGKTYFEAYNIDLPLVINTYRYFAGMADKISGTVPSPSGPIANGLFATIEKRPVGVVGAIIPWNFPLLMQAWKLAPALAAGCSMVVKTAPQTPLTGNRIGELAMEVGFPAGAINIVPGDDETGKIVANHQGFDKIAFTGSTAVGRKIMAQAAVSDNLQRVTLELGGKSPFIVYDDADMDTVVAMAELGVFLNQGQACCASSRIFVQEGAYDEFVGRAAAFTKARPVGQGIDLKDGHSHGAQVSQEQVDTIMRYINAGKEEGARLVAGGGRPSGKGFFVEPTVFADVTDDMTIAKEEIFGPVMAIMKFKDTDEVIERANASEYGLAAAVFTKDFGTARNFVTKVRAGSVWVNCYNTFDASLPFGGFKASGIGRELGEQCINNYLEDQTCVWNF